MSDVKVAFTIKTDGEFWWAHGEELLPGLNVCSNDLNKVLADIIPMWGHLHRHAPTQVPPPPDNRILKLVTASTSD